MTTLQKLCLRVLINNGFTSEVNRLCYSNYYWAKNGTLNDDTGEFITCTGKHYSYEVTKQKVAFFMTKYPHCWKLACNSNKAYYKRQKRLQRKIFQMLEKSSIFLTLTFNNDTLENTQAHIRRKYVSRFLSGLDCYYVANIDYGKENHREHYHALVTCDKVDPNLWKYGAINFERVRLNDENYLTTSKRLGKYVAKLTNHALKETTHNTRIIYDKKDKKDIADAKKRGMDYMPWLNDWF